MLTLTVGRTYRAKRPANSGGRVNDRTIVWKSQDGSLVQYDGPAVRFGAHYPKVTSDKFSEWEKSRGALIEHNLACAVGMDVTYE